MREKERADFPGFKTRSKRVCAFAISSLSSGLINLVIDFCCRALSHFAKKKSSSFFFPVLLCFVGRKVGSSYPSIFLSPSCLMYGTPHKRYRRRKGGSACSVSEKSCFQSWKEEEDALEQERLVERLGKCRQPLKVQQHKRRERTTFSLANIYGIHYTLDFFFLKILLQLNKSDLFQISIS